MRLFRLLSELKRRHVYQVAAAYAVAGFAVLEAADLVLPALPAPGWLYRALVILVLAGFPVVVALAWVFDITPEGVRRDSGPDPATDPTGASAIRLPTGRRLLAGTVVLGVVGVGAWLAGRGSTTGPASLDPSAHLAVLPFNPAVPDSGLERIGRELVVTLSSTLAGTADLSTAEPLAVLANVPAGRQPLTLAEAGQTAATLGAEHLLYGGLVRSGDGVRLELGLYETDGLRRLGTQAITAGQVDALTDSATLAALRLIWDDAPAAPPSPGAVSTGSLAALRAYLEGEGALAEGRWREAPEHFARAVAADSTFWFAYWRLQYALRYHGSPVDSVVRARVWEHRHELPDRDRLVIEAQAAELTERIRLLREATVRFPSYWPAWWDLAEAYVHNGGYLGHTWDDSRRALERTLELNPRFVSAWSHLFWVATTIRDTTLMRRVIDELSAAHYDRVTLQEAGINTLTYYEAQLDLVEADDAVPRAVVETGVQELSEYRGPADPKSMLGLMGAGFLNAQIELSREIIRHHAALPAMERAQQMILAHALAGRGGWTDAVAEADAFAASATEADDLLVPYRLAAVGTWAGEIDPDTARARRPGPGSAVTETPGGAAEVAWLDALLALTTADPAALEQARTDLAASGSRWQPLLDRSMTAFATALAGETTAAGRHLADLEMESAADALHWAYGTDHPFLNGVHRLTAARWLLAGGDTLTARRLLPWHEVVLPSASYPLRLANQVLTAPALRLRSALAEAAGREREAELYARLFRERWAPAAIQPVGEDGGP